MSKSVGIARQYHEGKLQWLVFPEEATTRERLVTKTAVPLGIFKTKKSAERYCSDNNYKISWYSQRTMP